MNDKLIDEEIDEDFYGAEYPEDDFDQEAFDVAMALAAVEDEDEETH